jgi:hypothetical protein
MLMFQNTTHFRRERKPPSTFCFSLLSGGFEYYKNEKPKNTTLSWLGAGISIKSGGITLF